MSQTLLLEVPSSFITLCEVCEVSPQAVLRGMIGVLCELHLEESRDAVGVYAAA